MEMIHTHYVLSHASSNAFIRNAISDATSLVFHVLKIVPGLVLIKDRVSYHALHLATCCHALKDAPKFSNVITNAPRCVVKNVQTSNSAKLAPNHKS